MRVFSSVQDFTRVVGSPLGESDWLTIGRNGTDTSAGVVDDRHRIHIDPECEVRRLSGSAVAQQYLTASLCPMLAQRVYRVEGAKAVVSYGLNRVRFITPVLVGSPVRARLLVRAAVPLSGDAVQVVMETTIELGGTGEPACVAETLTRFYFLCG